MMTEEQAREKWCPMARLLPVDKTQKANEAPQLTPRVGVSYNRLVIVDGKGASTNLQDSRCLASDCAMWRWDDYANNAAQELFENVAPHDADTKSYPPEPIGYCGLAGKPEAV